MKPYIAILIDSFNEAVASRVLWILFAAWTLILIGIAPFGFVEERTIYFGPQQFKDASGFMKQLEDARGGKGTVAQQRIAKLLREDTATAIKDFNLEKEGARRGLRRVAVNGLVENLNELLANKELYSEEAWPTASKRSNMKDLIAKGPGNLGASELEELNRRLIESAYSNYINQSAGDGLWLGYAGFKLFNQLPISRQQANQVIEGYALFWIIKLGLGIVAVFVAIIITSSLIPDMLQIGSLHLLLSKPISRSLLFLSKFFGGTIFVLLNITYLLVGLYFIAGFRFNIWNEGLLAAIPVIVFVFVIFFSVSALTGVIWRNAIISVVITILFWLFCFVIGFVRSGFSEFVTTFPSIVNLQEINGELLASTEAGQLKVWDSEKKDWIGATSNDFVLGERVIGPVLIAENKQFVYNRTNRGDFMFRGARGGVVVADLESAETDPEKKSKRNYRWDAEASSNLPDGTRQVASWKGTMLVLAESGLFRIDPKKLAAQENLPKSLFGFSLPKMNAVSPFERVSPDGWAPNRPEFFAIESQSDNVWCYHGGTLEKFVWKEKKFESAATQKVEGDASSVAIMAIGKTKGLLFRLDENPKVFDLADPKSFQEIKLSFSDVPRQIVYTGKDEKFAVVFQSGRFTIFDGASLAFTEPRFSGQGGATAVSLASDGNLWVAYSTRFVSKWDPATNTEVESRVAPRTTAQWIFDFIVNPIFIVNPKPAYLDDTLSYLLEGKSTTGVVSTMNTDVEQSARKLDPWTPLWSNALFVLFFLGVTCLYISRQEF